MATVVRLRSDNGEFEVSVTRDWTPTEPRVKDLPEDIREALLEWLDPGRTA